MNNSGIKDEVKAPYFGPDPCAKVLDRKEADDLMAVLNLEKERWRAEIAGHLLEVICDRSTREIIVRIEPSKHA